MYSSPLFVISLTPRFSHLWWYSSRLIGVGINKWVTTAATTLESTFSGASTMNGDLTKWDVSKVTTMATTFFQAAQFTGAGINTWITTNLATLAGTFKGASKMNADVGGWAVTKVTTLHNTFKDATKFTGTERKNRETERKRARKFVRARQRARARERDPTAFPSIAGEGYRGKWHRYPAAPRPVEEILYGVAHTVLVLGPFPRLFFLISFISIWSSSLLPLRQGPGSTSG